MISLTQVVSDKKKKDKALQAAHSWQFRASMQSKEGWLANLHRDLNKSSVKALDGSSLTEKQKKERAERRKKIISTIEMMDKSLSYTQAFRKEVVPANAKHYDPLDVVEDYSVLETQVTLGKGAGKKRKKLIENKRKKFPEELHPAAHKVSMSQLSINDQAFPIPVHDTLLHTFLSVKQLDSKHVTYSDLLHNSALVDIQGKAYRSAMAKFDKALTADSKHYPSLFNRASLFNIIGKPCKAIDDFESCTKVKPKNPVAYYNIGVIYNMNGKQKIASKYFEKSHRLDTHDSKILHNYALSLRRSGQYQVARREYRKLREHYRRDTAKEMRNSIYEMISNDKELKNKFLPDKKSALPKNFEYGTIEARKFIREYYVQNEDDNYERNVAKETAMLSLVNKDHSLFPMSDYKLEDRPKYLNPYLEKGFMAEKLHDDDGGQSIVQELLSVPPDERDEGDIDLIMKHMPYVDFFDRFPLKLRRKLFKLITYKIIGAGTTICKEGEMPKELNVVWTGKVFLQREVFHKFDSRIMTVGSVSDGKSLCEMELVRGIPYRNLAVASTDVEMLSLTSLEYNRTIKRFDEGDVVNKADIFRDAQIFNSWNDKDFMRIARLARSRFYNTGDIIINQKNTADEIFVMRRGLAVALHRETFDGKDYDIVVTKLCPGDIFGERSIINPISGKYRFSIKCDTRVEVLVLGKEMIPVSKVTHAVRDAIDEQCIRKFGRQTAIQAITDLRQHEINRKKVLHKLSYINAETYKKGHAGYKAPAWQKKRPWLPVNAPPLK